MPSNHTEAVRHTLLYGPPASGKLTVARALASRTGYRVVHNHLTTDLVQHLLERDSPGFWDTVRGLRLRLFECAASSRISVISTSAYIPADRAWVAEVSEALDRRSVQMCFVQLRPSLDELERRVVYQARHDHRKLVTVDGLHAALARADYFTKVHYEDLSIDNSRLSADDVAARIAAHYALASR